MLILYIYKFTFCINTAPHSPHNARGNNSYNKLHESRRIKKVTFFFYDEYNTTMHKMLRYAHEIRRMLTC